MVGLVLLFLPLGTSLTIGAVALCAILSRHSLGAVLGVTLQRIPGALIVANVVGQLERASTVSWRASHSALLLSWRKAQWQWLGPDTRPYRRSQPPSVPIR